MNQCFDEIQVFNGVAERTGNRLERAGVRGRQSVCRSLTELTAKARRMGDGLYYLVSAAWPSDSKSLNLTRPWVPVS